MNKKLLFFLLPLLSFFMVGCGDDNDVKSINLNLFEGTWEVVDPGNQNVFVRTTFFDITESRIHEGFSGHQGYITSYFITVDGTHKHDRVYTWSIREIDNQQLLLDLVYQGELESDDPWDGNYPYKVIKLTDTHMWWQFNTKGDKSIIKLRRCND